jgi:hypothetical protein
MKWQKWMTPVFALGLLVGGSQVSADSSANPPGKVWAHWSFDASDVKDGKVLDRGPLGHHATIEGDPAAIKLTQGIRGQGLEFAQGHESWIALPRNTAFELRPPFSMAAWVRPQSRRASMDILCQKAESWREGVRWVFSPRRMYFEYSDGKSNLQVRYDQHQTQVGQWAFIAMTHDGKTISLYIDGACVIREKADKLVSTARPAVIGNYTGDKKTYGLVGVLDELMIFREALTEDQILELGQWSLSQRENKGQ